MQRQERRHGRRSKHAQHAHHHRAPQLTKNTGSTRRRHKKNVVPSPMYWLPNSWGKPRHSRPKAVNVAQQSKDRRDRSRRCQKDKAIDAARRSFQSSHKNLYTIARSCNTPSSYVKRHHHCHSKKHDKGNSKGRNRVHLQSQVLKLQRQVHCLQQDVQQLQQQSRRLARKCDNCNT